MRYQQGTQRIEVIVRGEGVAGGMAGAKETDAGEQTGGVKTWRTLLFGSEDPQRIKRVVKTNLTHAFAVGKQTFNLALNYHNTGIAYATGDQALQETTQRQWEQVQDVTSVASAVGMGALYGSWGGPIGAVMGATLAAASTGTSLAVKYASRRREYSVKMFKLDNAITYARARAGINLTTGRLR